MNRAKQIALGGLLAALAVVLMLLGGIVPLATFFCPMLASLMLLPLINALPIRLCICWYVAVALLSLLLCPDRECAMLFVVLGYYPIVQPAFRRQPRWLRPICKLLLFAAAIGVMYAVLLFLFGLWELVEKTASVGVWLTAVTAALGVVCFFVYDLLLTRIRRLFNK